MPTAALTPSPLNLKLLRMMRVLFIVLGTGRSKGAQSSIKPANDIQANGSLDNRDVIWPLRYTGENISDCSSLSPTS